MTSTLFAQVDIGNIEAVQKMVSNDPSILLSKDEDERLAIHHAVSSGRQDMVLVLLNLGSPLHVLDESSWTPLHIAASKKHLDLAKILIENHPSSQSLRSFIDQKNNNGQTALHYAASKGSVPIVELLLENGANAMIKDNIGQLPIHRAASVGQLPIVQALLKDHPQQLNDQDKFKNTPLHLSIENNYPLVAKYLLSQNADSNLENNDQKSSQQLALEIGIYNAIFKH